MDKTHWRTVLQTTYLGGADLDDGKNGHKDITVTIKSVGREKVKDQTGSEEECLVMRLVGLKPMILNTTNSKMLEKLFGTSYIEDWSGKKMQIGTEKVKAFGDVYDALRVRKFLPKIETKTVSQCTDCKADIIAVGTTSAKVIVDGTTKTYGVPLCMDCASIRKGKA